MSSDPSKRPSTTTSSRPATKRVSTVPSAPKPPATIDPTAIIANHALLTGSYPIVIGARAVLHPYAKINSTEGPVIVGEGCVVWEKAVVGLGASDGGGDGVGVKLEKNVVVEACAVVEAEVIGEGSVVESFAKVGGGATVGKYCKITSFASLPPNSTLSDYTVVYGQNQRRKDTSLMTEDGLVKEIKAMAHQKQLKGFEKLIPSNLAKWV